MLPHISTKSHAKEQVVWQNIGDKSIEREAAVRTVTENCRTLRFEGGGFEEE